MTALPIAVERTMMLRDQLTEYDVGMGSMWGRGEFARKISTSRFCDASTRGARARHSFVILLRCASERGLRVQDADATTPNWISVASLSAVRKEVDLVKALPLAGVH